jgi:hypothetical protein
LLGRRGEHHEHARGVGAELLDDAVRVDAVVLVLGHRAHAVRLDRLLSVSRMYCFG